jgi:penicillin-binding protein 1B
MSKPHASRIALRLRRAPIRYAAASVVAVGLGYSAYLAWIVLTQFETRHWDLPAKVYAAPLELYAGRSLSTTDVVGELRRLGYRQVDTLGAAGTFRLRSGTLDIATRPFRFADAAEPSRALSVEFDGAQIRSIRDERGPAPIVRLAPVQIGSVFPAHGEDRLVVEPGEIPPRLSSALKAIEDQRFDEHHGVDPRSIGRALLVNLRSGEIRQGGSTLTQQLVKSYFLSNEQTLTRKLREAVMAIVLELAYDKSELMTAYINEVYLGQDGSRAVHGFGLASRFYFGKSLADLELHEMALLVAELRGPSYYDPRRFPERARERRDLVLDLLAERGVISVDESRSAAARDLGVVDYQSAATNYYPAFMDLVRRQLRTEYRDSDLATRGLSVFTTLSPIVQAEAERTLTNGLAALETDRAIEPGHLEGAVVVTSPQSAEVLAVVGGRRAGYDGFNRALDAYRPVGSLIKPAVYLAAIESGRYSLASEIDDSPIEVPLDSGRIWAPTNFTDETHGPVSLLRALSESFNLATVRLGLDVGPDRVAALLGRLGLERAPEPYPSMLLGALDLTPIEIAQIYNSLANGGFRTPLRSLSAVLDVDGEPLRRYPLEISQASSPDAVYQINQALVQVVERGTGRGARHWLPGEFRAAGKTGTSDGFRDSWFAGFTGDHLAVVWIGADDFAPTGLTGAAGALRIWASLIASLHGTRPYDPPQPAGLDAIPIEYASGLAANPRCADTVLLAVPADTVLEPKPGCAPPMQSVRRSVKRWVNQLVN